jgi:hypothetical protein
VLVPLLFRWVSEKPPQQRTNPSPDTTNNGGLSVSVAGQSLVQFGNSYAHSEGNSVAVAFDNSRAYADGNGIAVAAFGSRASTEYTEGARGVAVAVLGSDANAGGDNNAVYSIGRGSARAEDTATSTLVVACEGTVMSAQSGRVATNCLG